ncbi:roadblock/LC7 domain-containing protein [Streptomyces sp. NPDC001933]|uniref:roadblock/LC7 domain-containing protein n=1 Tax=Streptomyces sp. NPDC001933 TaxID=3364626 RepID=UPI0036A9F5E1
MTTSTNHQAQMKASWILDDIKGLKGVTWAVVLSGDGLVVARCNDLDRDTADPIAAAAAGYASVAKALGQFGGGALRQCMAEYDNAMIMATALAENSLMVVQYTHDGDVEVITNKVMSVAPNLAQELASKARTEMPGGTGLGSGAAGQL